jgi:hypothetical protein
MKYRLCGFSHLKESFWPVPVAQDCNCSFSGGKDQFKVSSWRPVSKMSNTTKEWSSSRSRAPASNCKALSLNLSTEKKDSFSKMWRWSLVQLMFSAVSVIFLWKWFLCHLTYNVDFIAKILTHQYVYKQWYPNWIILFFFRTPTDCSRNVQLLWLRWLCSKIILCDIFKNWNLISNFKLSFSTFKCYIFSFILDYIFHDFDSYITFVKESPISLHC